MGKRHLIDTNVVIDFAAGRLPIGGQTLVVKEIKNQPFISIINRIELLGFPSVPDTIPEFVDAAKILWHEDEVAQKAVFIRKTHRIKLPDAVIAATALVNGLILLTRNTKDFS